jgi:hypothetical protein
MKTIAHWQVASIGPLGFRFGLGFDLRVSSFRTP